MEFTIAVLAGDGIGPEVIAEAVKVLRRVEERFGYSFALREAVVGGRAIDEFGVALPDQSLQACWDSDAVLFGAVGGPQWDVADATERPEQSILRIRREFGLFANIRPAASHPALYPASPLKPEYLDDVDLIVLRELIGGLYFSRPKKRWETSTGKRRGMDTLRYSEEEIERVVRVGFELARQRRHRLTSTDKFNVMESSRLWREVASEVGAEYPDVELEHVLADNLAVQLLRNPSHFDVIVAGNIFGDLLSDEAAVFSGSLGMLPSASLAEPPMVDGGGKRLFGLYEPVHGSAPDIAGRGIANPIGAIRSLSMMLRYSFGMRNAADAVDAAVDAALSSGFRTPDLAHGGGGAAVGTQEMGDSITGSL